MDCALTAEQQRLIERVDALVAERIAPRAANYDDGFEAPREDIQDLHREGWLLSNLAREYGGLGYGTDGDDPLSFFLLIEHLARGNPATAHCFQVHNNTLQMISGMATPAQRERWIAPTVERGALLVGAGGEPPGAPPTTAYPIEGGFRVCGVKHYATNGTMAEWLWFSVGFEGAPKKIMMMIHRDTPGLRVDESWWRPTGMRACVSPTVYLDDCLVPQDSMLGEPGDFRTGHWLGKFHLAFTSNYLGAAQGMYDWIRAYMKERGSGKDLHRQAYLGELKARLDATRLLVYETARTYRQDFEQAMLLSIEAKWMAQETLSRVMQLGGDLAGSTAFFVKYPLERFYRDMHVHGLHSRPIIAAQMVGAAELGEPYDVDRTR